MRLRLLQDSLISLEKSMKPTLEQVKNDFPIGTVVKNFFGSKAKVIAVEEDSDFGIRLLLEALETSHFLTWGTKAGGQYYYKPDAVEKVNE
jgi:hypothetical protein